MIDGLRKDMSDMIDLAGEVVVIAALERHRRETQWVEDPNDNEAVRVDLSVVLRSPHRITAPLEGGRWRVMDNAAADFLAQQLKAYAERVLRVMLREPRTIDARGPVQLHFDLSPDLDDLATGIVTASPGIPGTTGEPGPSSPRVT